MVRSVLGETRQQDWSVVLPDVTTAYNITPHSTIQCALVEVIRGSFPNFPSILEPQSLSVHADGAAVKERQRAEWVSKKVRGKLKQVQAVYRRHLGTSQRKGRFKVGDSVMASNHVRKNKLDRR